MLMPDKPDRKRWGWGRWALIAALTLSLYVLSFGPAIWLSKRLDPKHTGWPGTVAATAYGPLVMASDLVGMKATLLDYLSLFVEVRR
jgi:hypothetical protein